MHEFFSTSEMQKNMFKPYIIYLQTQTTKYKYRIAKTTVRINIRSECIHLDVQMPSCSVDALFIYNIHFCFDSVTRVIGLL